MVYILCKECKNMNSNGSWYCYTCLWKVIDELRNKDKQPVEETTNDWIDEAYSEFVLKPWEVRHEDKSKSIFRQAIEKYMPKQELIPLDVERLSDEIYEQLTHNSCTYWKSLIQVIVENILSKYGTTPQKKRNKKEIEKVVWKYEKDSWDGFQAGKLKWAEEILRYMWLLEE